VVVLNFLDGGGGGGTVGFLVNTCVFWVWQNFKWAPVGFYHAQSGDSGLSPDRYRI